MTAETSIRFRSGAIDLAGRLASVPNAALGCVVCHPHPLYGGDMESSVVVAISQALAGAGVSTLRFDFRGAGASGGVHGGGIPEIDDARAAVDALAAATGLSRIAVAGYSFGGFVAMNLAATDDRICAVAAVSPPIAMPGFELTASIAAPMLLVAGDRDSYCPVHKLSQFAAGDDRAKTIILTGADHFFAGREGEVARVVSDFLSNS
ncbi:MAG TPA: alpha/beta fold hydrolase [Candidatus Limnocylindrales bacterium]|nr:alpha/beta fold hydrolase [Candidatus Limnocylindrales bacterium]